MQEENKSHKDQLSTMKLPPRRRDAHTWRGPQKSKTSNIGRLQVWPGKLCLRFNTNKLFRIYCVSDSVCSILCTFSHLISQHSYEANGYHLHFTENTGGTERVNKFPKVTQLILGVRI